MSRAVKHYFADKEVQLILGTLLRVGIIISTTIIFIGAVFFLFTNFDQKVNFNKFKQENSSLSSIANIIKGLKDLEGLAIIQFGILLLIFTPIARVVFSIFGFLIEKDYQYVLIGLIVLIIIITSLYLDIAH